VNTIPSQIKSKEIIDEILEPANSDQSSFGWKTVLLNCDCHTFDEVERQLLKAIRCTLSRARQIAWEVHSQGSAVIFSGPRERCEAVAAVLEDIRLAVHVTQ
jgi:ATP-dependent Clp protease adapter protein ClpS